MIDGRIDLGERLSNRGACSDVVYPRGLNWRPRFRVDGRAQRDIASGRVGEGRDLTRELSTGAKERGKTGPLIPMPDGAQY